MNTLCGVAHMKARYALIALSILFIQTACFAQDALKDTEAYVASVRAFAEKEGEPHLILADVSDYNEGSKPVWKRYGSLQEFENAREEEESYTVAFIWRQNGKPVAVNFTYSSPSGDWAHYVEYVFRADGSAAAVRRELRTFMGDLIVIRSALYDEKGTELKATAEYQDLETQKPVAKPKDFQDVDVPVYKKTSELPFFSVARDKAVGGKQ